MAHYIPKDALTEWMEKELREEYTCDNSEQEIGYHSALYRLQDLIDKTEAKDIADDLEVKEVDLDEEILNWIGDEASCKYGKWTWCECNKMIHYFFELGLKAQKGE